MFFSKQIPISTLAVACRSLGTLLDAGVSAVKSFELVAESATHAKLKEALQGIVADLRNGRDITTAIQSRAERFPELFLRMVSIGEQTGQLAEVMRALADHYEHSVRLRREFRSEITLPVLQFLTAICVVGGVIYVTGVIAELRAGRATEEDLNFDILGWGLQGGRGAATWLMGWVIGLLGGVLLYRLVSASIPAFRLFHRWILKVPVVGPCVQAFAVARFAWAFHLTQNAGVPMDESLDASLSATGNPHFQAASAKMVADLVSGKTLADAMRRSNLFDREFLQMVKVGEVSGTVPEVLYRLSPQFEDQAYRRMRFLSAASATLVWGTVALFIVFMIYRIALWYYQTMLLSGRGIEQML